MSKVCTTPMCAEGKASVNQMLRTFDDLTANPKFNRAHFEPTVHAIDLSFQDTYSMFSEYIPFNPTCCAVKDIGAQADTVTADMLRSVGAAVPGPGPGQTDGGFNVDALITLGFFVAGAVIVANLAPLVRKR